MSYSKIAFEQEDPGMVTAMRCEVCDIEATEGNKGSRITDDVWLCSEHRHLADSPEFREGLGGGTVRLFYAGDDAELDAALDAYFDQAGE